MPAIKLSELSELFVAYDANGTASIEHLPDRVRDSQLNDARGIAAAVITLCVASWGAIPALELVNKLTQALEAWENEVRKDERAKWALEQSK